MNTKKKIIIFGCSITPLLVIIGTIIYSSSSKNNVHQNNLQLKEEKKEISTDNKKEYIPCLDNDKIQISLWFIIEFILPFLFSKVSPKSMFEYSYQVFWFRYIASVKKISKTKMEYGIVIVIRFLVKEFILSFVYLPVCWINKKPLKKAFSIYHRFWWKSWTNLFLSFIIELIFFWTIYILITTIKYFIGSFYYDEKQKEMIGKKNLAEIGLDETGLDDKYKDFVHDLQIDKQKNNKCYFLPKIG